MRKISPTSLRDRQRPKKRPIGTRRRKAPEIFVWGVKDKPYAHHGMIKAHLRNKRGYVYLCWRENGTVRNFYLGKAPRSCPTGDPRSELTSPAAVDPPRRARISPKTRATLPQERPEGKGPTPSTPENRRKFRP